MFETIYFKNLINNRANLLKHIYCLDFITQISNNVRI
jgi:hypothetical protein